LISLETGRAKFDRNVTGLNKFIANNFTQKIRLKLQRFQKKEIGI